MNTAISGKPSPPVRKSALWGAMVLSASSIGLQALGFAYRIFISRATGASGMGVFQLVMPVYAILISITFSGLTTAVTNISSEKNALGDAPGMRSLIRTSLAMFFALFLLSAAPAALFSGFISEHVLGDAETRLALLIMLPCLLLTGVENVFKSWFYGIKNVSLPAISDNLEQVVRIAAVVALLLGFRPQDPAMAAALIVAGMTVSETFSSAFLTVQYLKRRPRPARTPHTRDGGKLFRQIVSVAFPVSASALLGNLLYSANTVLVPQRLIVSGMPQADAVGALGVIVGMAMPLYMLPMAFIGPLVTVMLPRLSEGCALHDMKNVHRKMGQALHATGLLALPAVAIMIPIGPAACELLFGQILPERYFLLLALSLVFEYYRIVTTGIMNGTGLQNRAMVNNTVGGVLELGFTWFMVADPRFGIYGFMYGMLFSSLLSAALNMLCLGNRMSFRFQWGRWFLMPALAAAATGLAAANVYMFAGNAGLGDVPAMAWAFAAGAFAFLLCLWIQGVGLWKYLKQVIPLGKARTAAFSTNSFLF
jgi:stage V sporulation protein B